MLYSTKFVQFKIFRFWDAEMLIKSADARYVMLKKDLNEYPGINYMGEFL